MNAREEANARLGGRFDARVLEPSPPAVLEGPWFADDPVGRGRPRGELPRVLPVAGGELQWEDLLAEDPSLAEWCAERWLAAHRRLAPAPAKLVATRLALHRLAEEVIAPARRAANTKIGLRFTRGGFGTPFFGDEIQLRVCGGELILQCGELERAAEITSLAATAALLGVELLADPPRDETPLEIDAGASAFLGDWFGFATSVLEELRAGVADSLDPSRVQIWPEHFDAAIEIGLESRSQRAGYGASPGDELHPEPYLYVVPWAQAPEGELWQAQAFRGAELPYSELLAAADQHESAVRFFTERLLALTA
jgi:hypothetical protein